MRVGDRFRNVKTGNVATVVYLGGGAWLRINHEVGYRYDRGRSFLVSNRTFAERFVPVEKEGET